MAVKMLSKLKSMEFLLSFTSVIAAIFAFLLLFYHLAWTRRISHRNKVQAKTVPCAAGAWPIIGHLPLLAGPELPHKILGSMADKFGPIFTIKLGVHQALVVSNSEMARECFTTNDKVFATRPKSMAVEVMAYNYAMFGFAPYGEYWIRVRKFVVLELLSHQRLQMMSHIRASEVKLSIKDIYEHWMKVSKGCSSNMEVKMDMKQRFGSLVLNMLVRVMSGKRYSHNDEEGERFKKAARKFSEYLGAFVVSDVVPGLRWLDLGGYEKAMKKIAKEMDDIMEEWLAEHKRKKKLEGEEQDFMDVMLSRLEGESQENIAGFDTDTITKATCMAIQTAASDNMTATLTWALALLVNNPQALQNAQQELDINVGRERQVKESDIKNLVYIQAIIKETLRLYPAVVTIPRESMEDCIVGGYHIPKGTHVLVNVWKINHDPQFWSDPYEFRPERFLTTHKEVDVRGKHFEFVPFGGGRRTCPGISFALQAVHLTLASLIHGFEIRNPSAQRIDMRESFGLTNAKVTPLEVLLTPRLSLNLYE